MPDNAEIDWVADDLGRVLSGTAPDVWAKLNIHLGERYMWRRIAGRAFDWAADMQALDDAMRESCYEEVYSLDYFRGQQVDPYWITCTKVGPHVEHEDSNTGAHWPVTSPALREGGDES